MQIMCSLPQQVFWATHTHTCRGTCRAGSCRSHHSTSLKGYSPAQQAWSARRFVEFTRQQARVKPEYEHVRWKGLHTETTHPTVKPCPGLTAKKVVCCEFCGSASNASVGYRSSVGQCIAGQRHTDLQVFEGIWGSTPNVEWSNQDLGLQITSTDALYPSRLQE